MQQVLLDPRVLKVTPEVLLGRAAQQVPKDRLEPQDLLDLQVLKVIRVELQGLRVLKVTKGCRGFKAIRGRQDLQVLKGIRAVQLGQQVPCLGTSLVCTTTVPTTLTMMLFTTQVGCTSVPVIPTIPVIPPLSA